MRYLAAALIGTMLAPPIVADIITPSGVSATSQFGLGIVVVDSLIDSSGLDGNGAIEEQLHSNIDDHMWFSGCQDAGVPGGLPPGEECADAFAVAPVNEQIVEFELDGTYDLSSAVIWQYSEFNPDVGPVAGRGVKSFEMLVSPNLSDEFTSLGNFELAIGDPGAEAETFNEPAQTLALDELAGTDSVRRVQFKILEAHDPAQAYVGLSEVRFDGVQLPAGPGQLAGDCNQDGALDIADVVCSVNLLFPGFNLLQSAPQDAPCSDDAGNLTVLDVDGNEAIDGSDVALLASYLFRGGPPPAQGSECFPAVESCGANAGCE